MANSIQTAGNRAQHFRDLDIIAFISLLDSDLMFEPEHYPALERLFARWQQNIEAYAPGTIDLQLDVVTVDSRMRSEMLRFLAEAERCLMDRGGTILASILNEHCRAPGVKFFDYQTRDIVDVVRKLRELVC